MAQTLNRLLQGTDRATRSASLPVIREARLDDYEKISALQSGNGLASRSYEDWSMLWTSNPAYIHRDCPFERGWILEGTGGEVGGYLGNLPLMYRFNGQTIYAATPYSWVVDPQYRSYSLMLLFQFLRQGDVDLFVCTTPNGIAEKVLRAFKFSKVPSGRWDEAGFWITGYRGFARSVLRAAPLPLPHALAAPLAAGLYLGDAARSLGKRVPDLPARSTYEFDFCSSFPAAFDCFWHDMENENKNRLLAVRTRETLAWHFGQALAKGRVWILAAYHGARLVAYAILDRQNHPALDLRRLRVVDFQALRGFEGLLQPALQWLLHKSWREGIHVIENVGCWLERFQVPGTAAGYHRRLQSWLFYYKTPDRELFHQLQDPAVWTPSAFDGDASL
jgi:hypothetical protein